MYTFEIYLEKNIKLTTSIVLKSKNMKSAIKKAKKITMEESYFWDVICENIDDQQTIVCQLTEK